MRNVKKALVVGALAPLALTLFLLAFLWPMATMEPRDVSTAVVGESQQVTQIQKALDEKKPGLLKTQPASDRAEAERLVQQRDVSGAIVLGQEPEVLYSSAAGLPQANIIKNLSQPLSEMANHQAKAAAQARGLPEHKVPSVDVKARDLAPLDSRDPQGAGINFSILPVAFGGMIGAALISFVLQKNTQRLLAFAVYTHHSEASSFPGSTAGYSIYCRLASGLQRACSPLASPPPHPSLLDSVPCSELQDSGSAHLP